MPRPTRPSRRRAWTLTITSALLAVVWVVSLRVEAFIAFTPKCGIDVWGGVVGLWYTEQPFHDQAPHVEFTQRDFWFVRWWFMAHNFSNTQAVALSIPLWPFILLTGVPGGWMLAKSRRGKGAGANLCPTCGYDLTGLPATRNAPCPECGKR